jgi:flagellar FliL protein
MALVDQLPEPRKGPSIIVQIAVLLVLTLMAVGVGWLAGNYLGNERPVSGGLADTAAPAAASGHGAAAGGHGGAATAEGGHGEEEPANPLLVSLAPMTTNLAAPSTVWIRLEIALLLSSPQPQDMLEAIHQDLFTYVKTLKLHQIEGASGYQHLKTDLDERARIRSDGQVKEVLIRTLLFE